MKLLCKALALAVAVTWLPVRQAAAEDIDLFVGATGTGVNPNILLMIDNSANWNAASQGWPGGIKQGQSELRAVRTVVNEIRPTDATSSRVNLGLMMFTPGQGSDIDGGYVRFHIRPMTQVYVDSLRELIGDETCSDGNVTIPALPAGSAVTMRKCIAKNFNDPFEMTATADTDYSAALFEAFKYFGGYTDVAHANSDPAVAGIRPGATGGTTCPVGQDCTPPHTFGVTRRAGTVPASTTSDEYRKFDAAAYNEDKTAYVSPIGTTNACAKNYIIVIGNGFPIAEPNAWDSELLYNVNQPSTQLTMPVFSTLSNSVTANNIGTSCGSSNAGVTQQRNDCTANIPQSLKDANPADSYVCVGSPLADPGNLCPGGNNELFSVNSTKTVITATPTGTFATPAANKTRYADEWTKFLATTDVSDAGGQQTVSTYTIDVFKDQQDADQTALLMSMARYGAGKYFQATSEQAIIDALRSILIEIQSVNTVFASASLPINATNRSQNENQVFIGMFRPTGGGRPRWYGNLKRYQIALIGGSAVLADATGQAAVGPSGFVAPCARSFWTSDTGDYWNFAQGGVTSFAGLCTTAETSLLSDKPDGSQVEKGAVAEVLRRGNNPPSTAPFTYADVNLPDASPIVTPAPAAVNRTMLTCRNNNTTTTFDNSLISCNIGTALHALNNTNIADKDALGSLVFDNAERDNIIKFTQGEDIAGGLEADLNQNTSTTDVRPDVHGDVAHSRPLPVNYGGSVGVVLYYGANDGTFRAVQGRDGKELWAFIAPEHHDRLKRLRDNTPLIKYPGSVDPTELPKDYFFDGSAGVYQTFNADNTANTVWLFPSMRRGGRMLYGFNVTDPANPRMLWRLGCPKNGSDDGCSIGFTGIGQTWSIPAVAKIKGYPSLGAETPVIIVGGGYDSCDDNDHATTTCSSPKGRNVYVLDAASGALLKTFGTGGTGTIDRSVIADVTLVDLSFEGFAQHAYVVDTGGNLYRIDFRDRALSTDLALANWRITKIAYTAGGSRKFQFAPAALPSAGKVFLTLGSGDRERPLINNYPYDSLGTKGGPVSNRFYMFMDTFPTEVVPPATVPTPTAAVNLDGTAITDFSTSTSCAAALPTSGAGSNGWRIDLNTGRGEQTVTSSTIFGGLVFFSTNRPLAGVAGSCSNNLGEARGYAVNLLNASGAVGVTGLCGGSRSNYFLGGGLPPSPVTGTVPVDGKPVTVMIGGIDRTGAASSPIGSQKVTPSITQRRSRIYWYRQGDQ